MPEGMIIKNPIFETSYTEIRHQLEGFVGFWEIKVTTIYYDDGSTEIKETPEKFHPTERFDL